MKISIENIAKVKSAEIEIKGITVLAGKNDTGKSTIGKLLYSVFNSIANVQDRIDEERKKNISIVMQNLFRNLYGTMFHKYSYDIDEVAGNLVSNIEQYLIEENVYKYLFDVISQYGGVNLDSKEKIIKDYSSQILEILLIQNEDILEEILNGLVNAEFCGQINNIDNNSEGSVSLFIKDSIIKVDVKENGCFLNKDDITLGTEVIYIDDPYVLESEPIQRGYFGLDHKSHLRKRVYFENNDKNVISDMILSNKFKAIVEKLNSVCEGDIVLDSRSGRFGYKKKQNGKILDIRNLSAGLKSFAIIKSLLENKSIDVNGTIILDEPEIHLHPEWQLIFAELVVLMQLSFNLHILINTHSPYFLNAIEVYSAKYNIKDKCKYYLSDVDENNLNIMTDVTDDLEMIYIKLAQPLQQLENEGYADE